MGIINYIISFLFWIVYSNLRRQRDEPLPVAPSANEMIPIKIKKGLLKMTQTPEIIQKYVKLKIIIFQDSDSDFKIMNVVEVCLLTNRVIGAFTDTDV